MLGIYILRWLLLVRSILRVLDAEWMEFLSAMLWPFLSALAASLPAWGIDHLILGLPSPLRLAVDMAMAIIGLLLITRLFGKSILRGSHGDFLLADGRMPDFLRLWLRM